MGIELCLVIPVGRSAPDSGAKAQIRRLLLNAGLEGLLHPLRGSHLSFSFIIHCRVFQIQHPLFMNPHIL
jgi:hypothetical protein